MDLRDVSIGGPMETVEKRHSAVENFHSLRFMRGGPTIRYRIDRRNPMLSKKPTYAQNDRSLRLFVENAPIPLFTYDPEGKILFWNAALRALLGEPALRGQTFEAIAGGGASRRIRSVIRSVFQGHGITDICWETGAEEKRVFSASTFPLKGVGAEVTAAMAIVTEITEKKRLEQALIQSEKMAALGTLASGIAHEFGTPLNIILGRAESLRRQTQDEKGIGTLTTIIEQVDRMAEMVRQLLTFARRKPPARERTHLNRIIEKGMMLCAPQLHGVAVTTDLCPHLPEMWGDADQLLQVLLNLLINARNALPTSIHIETRLAQIERRRTRRSVSDAVGHRTIRMDVRDDGTGIHPHHIDHIFNPFFTTNPVGSGTGLGLAVVQGIVRDHAGQIRVSSVVGQGTTFQVLLPVG